MERSRCTGRLRAPSDSWWTPLAHSFVSHIWRDIYDPDFFRKSKGMGRKIYSSCKEQCPHVTGDRLQREKCEGVRGGCYRKARWRELELLKTEGKGRTEKMHNWSMDTAASGAAEAEEERGGHRDPRS